MIQKLYKQIKSILPKTRKSNPVSKLLRPLFEGSKFKSYLGMQLAGVAAFVGVMSFPTQAFDYSISDSEYINATPKEVITETTFEFPLTAFTGISQGFYKLHPGIDLRAPIHTGVVPVLEGRVKEVVYSKYGYGHYIMIDHKEGYSSLYAHLGRMYVSTGENVNRDTVIGEVGMTGWTTGPHLHLEIHHDGYHVNPMSLLPSPGK